MIDWLMNHECKNGKVERSKVCNNAMCIYIIELDTINNDI